MVRNPKNKKLYKKVRQMRKQGLSYGNISKKCNTSKSNISLWCRDIKLTKAQYKKLLGNQKNNYLLGSKKLHEKREAEIKKVREDARKYIKKLTTKEFFIAGVVMYWAEGSKKTSTSITNSDERVILLMLKWFHDFFNIDIKTRVKAHLHIHAGNEDKKIKLYWSKLTGIPLENFGKSFVKPKGTGHRKNILPNGIIRIRVSGQGTEDMRHKIMSWVDKIYELSIKKPL